MYLRPFHATERSCGRTRDDYGCPVDVVAERCAKVKNARSAVVRIVVMVVLVMVRIDAVFGVAVMRSLGLFVFVILIVFASVIVRWLGARRMMVMVLIVRVRVMRVLLNLGAAMRMNRIALLLRVVVLREVNDRVADVDVIGAMEGMVERRRDDGAVTIDKDRPGSRRKRAKKPPHLASEYEFRAGLDGLPVGTHAPGREVTAREIWLRRICAPLRRGRIGACCRIASRSPSSARSS